MPAKLDRCVDDIKAKGDADGVNPWAVCNASIDELKPEDTDKLLNELDDITSADASFPSADASYKHTGPMVPTDKEHSYENTPEEMLQEIDNMISKDASSPKASYKFTGDMTTKMKPNTYGNTGNETVSIPGSLSAVKIKGKKREGSSMMQEIVYKSILDNKLSHPCKCKNKK